MLQLIPCRHGASIPLLVITFFMASRFVKFLRTLSLMLSARPCPPEAWRRHARRQTMNHRQGLLLSRGGEAEGSPFTVWLLPLMSRRVREHNPYDVNCWEMSKAAYARSSDPALCSASTSQPSLAIELPFVEVEDGSLRFSFLLCPSPQRHEIVGI